MLDVLGKAYSDTPRYLWFIAAGNVLLHVGRLEKLGKLPKVRLEEARKVCLVELMQSCYFLRLLRPAKTSSVASTYSRD